MNILIFTTYYSPGHEKRDLNLVREFINSNNNIIYAVPVIGIDNFVFPVYPDSYKEDKDFQSVNTFWFNNRYDLLKKIDFADLVLMGTCRGLEDIKDYIKKTGKPLIQHQDIGGFLNNHNFPDLYCVRGEWHKQRLLKYSSFPEEKIVITGCVQFDAACPKIENNISKEDFCKKYNLNPNKKIAVWLPSSPANHNSAYKQLYKDIIRTVNDCDHFQVIIKGHPSDYSGHKRDRNYKNLGKKSWELLTPGTPVCQLEDVYNCFRFCDVGISVCSSVSMEFPLFKKPFIYVNLHEELLPEGIENIVKIPRESIVSASLSKLMVHENVMKIARISKQMPTNFTNPKRYENGEFEYIGIECHIDQLHDVLNSNAWDVNDHSIYDHYVQKYCFKNDGLAYKRIYEETINYLTKHQKRKTILHFFNKVIMKQKARIKPAIKSLIKQFKSKNN